jgi:phosphopantetheinyl transferase
MPVFFQQTINASTRLGIWKIEETEAFFIDTVPLQREITHPHKRLQHLAGRFLLRFIFPDFPYELIEIADTQKPFLPGEQYHFSISHCGDYAAAIVSKDQRVGIDIEIPVEKIERLKDKFLSAEEMHRFTDPHSQITGKKLPVMMNREQLTLLWSCKESVFKWYGDGEVDFKNHIRLQQLHEANETIDCFFTKKEISLTIHYRVFEHLVLSWVVS